MKYLSLRLIFLCVFLPPVLYIYTLQAGEWIVRNHWKSELEQGVISDPHALLQGRENLEEHIARNIQDFVQDRWLVKLGIKPRIWVGTKAGHSLYPSEVSSFLESGSSQAPLSSPFDNAPQVAAHNLELLKHDLVVGLSVHISRDSWIANIILVVYILMFSSFLIFMYLKRAREVEEQRQSDQYQLMQAQEQIAAAETRLQELKSKEEVYTQEVEELKQELKLKGQEVKGTEEEALAELEAMETKLRESEELRRVQEERLNELQEEASHLHENRNYSLVKKKKIEEIIAKRFATLYKNLYFDKKAIDGFLDLSDDMQIKAEECIHILNQDSNLIKIKRKVFIRKGSMSVFESNFAYKGRMYWMHTDSGKIRVLVLGTKNTQNKDMKYIETIA
jgi:hypothetical protein